jgi:hypothetical protein
MVLLLSLYLHCTQSWHEWELKVNILMYNEHLIDRSLAITDYK